MGSSKKVHLVLGSGGARGMAHIGIIEKLEEEGYEIIDVIGCSMGAIVGGIYAAGHLLTYKEWLLYLTKTRIFNILDFDFSMQGFLKGERVFRELEEFTVPQRIEDMKIRFRAVVADVLHNKEIIYDSGDLYKALRASIAIPGTFTPVFEKDRLLVDGAVLNPLPLNHVRKKGDELIIAVNLNGFSPDPTMVERIKGNSHQMPSYSLRELLLKSYKMTQDRLSALILETHPPDIYIEIPRNTCTTFEFHKAKDLIEIGKNAYVAAMKEYKKRKNECGGEG